MRTVGEGIPSPDSRNGAHNEGPSHDQRSLHQETRRTRTNEKLVPAVLSQLDEFGYSGFTIERLSAQSGVAKTTIYRRWSSKAELIFDLVFHQPTQGVPVDGRTLVEDIHILATHAVSLLDSPTGRIVFPGLLADVAADPALGQRLDHEFIAPVRHTIELMFTRAKDRGEITRSPNVQLFHATLLGVPYAARYLVKDLDPATIVRELEKQLFTIALEPDETARGN